MMRKSKLIILQLIIALVLTCTSSYAAINATISLTQSKTELKRGEIVTVTLSLKDVDSSKKITSVAGYINYNEDVIEDITAQSINKDSDGTVTIGTEKLKVEDLTTATIDTMPSSDAYIGFNGNPSSNNDSRIVIDFNNGVTSDVNLLSINFKVKSDATLGKITNAISYSMFVITSDSEQSAEITKNIDLTVVQDQEQNPDEPTPTEKTLSRIEVTKAPTKTTYTAGEKFDKTGMEVTATYSDNSTSKITNYSYTPTTSLSTTDTVVTISYTEGNVTKTATQAITVKSSSNNGNDNDSGTKTLSSIEVTKTPTKTTYTEGEKFDKSGMEVTVKYSDGTSKKVTDYTISPTTALKTSDSKVTISYKENGVTKTVDQKITVKAASGNKTNNVNNTNNTNTNSNTNTKGNTNTKDNTTAGSKLPATGTKLMVLPVIGLIILSYISYKKYLKYKDI